MRKDEKKFIEYLNEQIDVDENFKKIESKIVVNDRNRLKKNKVSILRYVSLVLPSIILLGIFIPLAIDFNFSNLAFATSNSSSRINENSEDQSGENETISFVHQNINYQFRTLPEDEKPVDVVGDYLATYNDIMVYYKANYAYLGELVVKYQSKYYYASLDSYVNKENITMAKQIQDIYGFSENTINKVSFISSSGEELYTVTDLQETSMIYHNLLDSSEDASGFDQLLMQIFTLFPSGDSLCNSQGCSSPDYQGGVEQEYTISLENDRHVTLNIFYYQTRAITNPKFIMLHNIIYRVNDNMNNWITTIVE